MKLILKCLFATFKFNFYKVCKPSVSEQLCFLPKNHANKKQLKIIKTVDIEISFSNLLLLMYIFFMGFIDLYC